MKIRCSIRPYDEHMVEVVIFHFCYVGRINKDYFDKWRANGTLQDEIRRMLLGHLDRNLVFDPFYIWDEKND